MFAVKNSRVRSAAVGVCVKNAGKLAGGKVELTRAPAALVALQVSSSFPALDQMESLTRTLNQPTSSNSAKQICEKRKTFCIRIRKKHKVLYLPAQPAGQPSVTSDCYKHNRESKPIIHPLTLGKLNIFWIRIASCK